MDCIRKEIKYSMGNDEINVLLHRIWPMSNVSTDNYELLNYVLDDINKNYLTVNGALVCVENDNEQVRDVMQKNNFNFMNRSYKIENKIYDIDMNKYKCSSTITDREKEYYAKYMNVLNDVDTGIDVITNLLEKEYFRIYTFYDNEELVGIMTLSLIDGEVSLHDIYTDNKDIMLYMIKYAVNEYNSDISTKVTKKAVLLMEVLDEIGAVVEWTNYRGSCQLN